MRKGEVEVRVLLISSLTKNKFFTQENGGGVSSVLFEKLQIDFS